MADFNKITKKQFDAAYNKHLPNNWVKFVFRYFSTNTEKNDLKLRDGIKYVAIAIFGVGFIGTIFNASRVLVGTATLAYSGIIVLIGLTMGSGVILNNLRIKKIIKELGITKEQYNALVTKFYS